MTFVPAVLARSIRNVVGPENKKHSPKLSIYKGVRALVMSAFFAFDDCRDLAGKVVESQSDIV